MDPYTVLGVKKDATQDEIKKAYQKVSKTCHPDSPTRTADNWEEVSAAYAVLSDPKKRRIYDDTGINNPDHEQMIRQLTVGLFMSALGAQDPVAEAMRNVRHQNSNSLAKSNGAKRDIEIVKDVLGRLLHDGSGDGDSPVKAAMLQRIVELEQAISSAAYEIQIGEDVMTELKRYAVKPKKVSDLNTTGFIKADWTRLDWS